MHCIEMPYIVSCGSSPLLRSSQTNDARAEKVYSYSSIV